ncbi:DMT family transporter [Rhodopila sp.]|uniref:DMT family transporter n=1 Tax=Rhodopila sp. TaxID=2480087 RepID=UPI002C197FD1|nr:DMT family transporter [Rhodopila sp.]HVZ10685.1 DMT family transporter [Rhodopila sp.]
MSGHVDNPLRGIGLNLLASLVFCMGDTIAKQLSQEVAVVQIVWTRYVVFALMALLITTQIRGASFFVQRPGLQIARGLCLVGSSLFFILGIRDIGLAEATTIGFIGPILVTMLSIPLLKERVEPWRWLALAAGMTGVLIVLRPGAGTFQPEALYRVASAGFWAAGVILTRRMTATERAETTMFWSAITGLVVLSVLVPFQFAPPTSRQLSLQVCQGVLSSLGQWLVILSLRMAPASTLAPFSYVSLLWMTIAGFVVFSVLPDQWTVAGATIIVSSGLYGAQRERRRMRLAHVPVPVALTVGGRRRGR